MRIMAPSPARLRMRLTMTLVPGVVQSRASSLQIIVVKPSRLAFDSILALTTPYGGRKSVGRTPITCWITLEVRLICESISSLESKARLGCDQLWLPTRTLETAVLAIVNSFVKTSVLLVSPCLSVKWYSLSVKWYSLSPTQGY